MMDFTFTSQLHYLVHQVDGEHVAHCLDLDLVGSGNSVGSAVEQLNDAVRAVVYLCMVKGTSSVKGYCSRAPEEYWEMFRRALDDHDPVIHSLNVGGNIPPVTVMECNFTYVLAVAA